MRLADTNVVLDLLRELSAPDRAALAGALDSEGLVPWDRAVASAALELLSTSPRLDVVDCLLAARSQIDGDDVVTSDRLLQRVISDVAQPRTSSDTT